MLRGRRVPNELLPVLMVWTWVETRAHRVKDRARQVQNTRDLGALSFEAVALAIGLCLVAIALTAFLTNLVTQKAATIKTSP